MTSRYNGLFPLLMILDPRWVFPGTVLILSSALKMEDRQRVVEAISDGLAKITTHLAKITTHHDTTKIVGLQS
jgi:hypothetical protein